MKICMICEGCYPYILGGVSSWLHDLILNTPENEYVIWAIGAEEKRRGKFMYPIPDNVSYVHEVFLDTAAGLTIKKRAFSKPVTQAQREALQQLFSCGSPDWEEVFRFFNPKGQETTSFLSTRLFLELAKNIVVEDYQLVSFNDFFWTLRSMFLPLLYLLGGEIPEADQYHAVSAGYAGVLGAMAASLHHKGLVLTEHGIYTREREEEIIRTNWVPQHFKDMWIQMFYMYTRCAYAYADRVTALFQRASLIQQEIGSLPDRSVVIHNGVRLARFEGIEPKAEDGWVDVGAVVRVAPIKDIKTMLYAFMLVNAKNKKIRLHIMGTTTEDEEYYEECVELVKYLQLESHVKFTGQVDIAQYIKDLDFVLLTSISEGQPLAILEAFAAKRPVVATDVGSCRELIEGPDDDFGHAGFCVPVMHQSAIAEAILTLSQRRSLRLEMGEIGYKRVVAQYGHPQMVERYRQVYQEAAQLSAEKWKAK